MHKHVLRGAAATIAAAAVATAGLLALAAPANAASLSSSTPTCDQASWVSAVQGAPAGFKAGAATGDYLWHDAHGFHLRVAHPGHGREVFTGVITSTAPMSAKGVDLEKGDIVKLSKNRRTLSFSFVDYGRVDGVDFRTDCAAALTVSRLHVGDRDLPTSDVRLGAHEQHPDHVPFAITRTA